MKGLQLNFAVSGLCTCICSQSSLRKPIIREIIEIQILFLEYNCSLDKTLKPKGCCSDEDKY